MTREISIPAAEVIPAIAEGRPVAEGEGTGEVCFVCDGVRLALASEEGQRWKVHALACDHPCHAAHPRYRAAYERLSRKFGKLLPKATPEDECPKCRGSGWLPADSPEAGQLFAHVVTMQIYKGVVLAPEKYEAPALNADALRATLSAFLTGGGNSPAAISDSPAGTAPGRAPLTGDEVEE